MITQKQLKERLHYDPETGNFTWRYSYRKQVEGKIAGTLDGLAFLYMTGRWPKKNLVMAHINRDRLDNRWSNLREVSASDNTYNRTAGNNRTGFRGVIKRYGSYVARIQKDGKQIQLGWFATAEEASKVYEEAADKYFGHLKQPKE